MTSRESSRVKVLRSQFVMMIIVYVTLISLSIVARLFKTLVFCNELSFEIIRLRLSFDSIDLFSCDLVELILNLHLSD